MRIFTELALAKYLFRRARKREIHLIRRKRDATLWAAWHPQDFGYAMRGLFDRSRDNFHFIRVRIWRGVPIASPRIIWLPRSREFDVLHKQDGFVLPAWPEQVENARIDALEAAKAA